MTAAMQPNNLQDAGRHGQTTSTYCLVRKMSAAMQLDDSQGSRQTTSTYCLVRKMTAAMQPDDSQGCGQTTQNIVPCAK